jgi:hypothetical protein
MGIERSRLRGGRAATPLPLLKPDPEAEYRLVFAAMTQGARIGSLCCVKSRELFKSLAH